MQVKEQELQDGLRQKEEAEKRCTELHKKLESERNSVKAKTEATTSELEALQAKLDDTQVLYCCC